jgi:catechol 2,3-dioxygenase-like lactoylglutathione lyase family enzyme
MKLNQVTLPATDLAVSIAFYRGLGPASRLGGSLVNR